MGHIWSELERVDGGLHRLVLSSAASGGSPECDRGLSRGQTSQLFGLPRQLMVVLAPGSSNGPKDRPSRTVQQMALGNRGSSNHHHGGNGEMPQSTLAGLERVPAAIQSHLGPAGGSDDSENLYKHLDYDGVVSVLRSAISDRDCGCFWDEIKDVIPTVGPQIIAPVAYQGYSN